MPGLWVRGVLATLCTAAGTVVVASAPANASVEATPQRAQAEPCAASLPAGWQVIHIDPSNPDNDPSATAAGPSFICNYRIKHDAPLAGGGTSTFINGAAITVEYLCSAGEATEAFDGKAGERDTEVDRSDTHLVIEEGPLAQNSDNPQDTGVFSNFFPDAEFNLFEKEFILLNSQIVATIVVLSGERGPVDEEQRFGVDDAEPVARNVADANRVAAGCSSPVPGVSSTSSPKGGSKAPVIIAVGGGTIVVIAGGRVLKRKRKRPKGNRPPRSNDAPAPCIGALRSYEHSRDRYLDLKEALDDISEQLRASETLHANNIMKIKLIGAWELASIAGSAAGDAAGAAFRPKPPSGPIEMDTWKGAGGKSPGRLATALASAKEALENALGKVRQLVGDLDALKTMRRSIDEHPLVQAAQRVKDNAMAQLSRARSQLKMAQGIEAEIGNIDHTIRTNEFRRQTFVSKRFQLDGEIASLETQLANRKSSFEKGMDRYMGDMEKFTSTADGANVGKTIDTATENFNAAKRSGLGAEMVDDYTKGVRDIRDMESKLKVLQREGEITDVNLGELSKQLGRELDDRDRLLQKYREFGDMSPDKVATLEKHAAEADHDYDMAHGRASTKVEADMAAVQKQLEQANNEASAAQLFWDNMRKLGESATDTTTTVSGGTGAMSGPDKAARTWTVGSALTAPVRLIGRGIEWAIGSQQSPEEMWEILQRGRRNIDELITMTSHLDPAVTRQLQRTKELRQLLDDCRKTHAAPDVGRPQDRHLSPPSAEAVVR